VRKFTLRRLGRRRSAFGSEVGEKAFGVHLEEVGEKGAGSLVRVGVMLSMAPVVAGRRPLRKEVRDGLQTGY
jgi:hypothetical protein